MRRMLDMIRSSSVSATIMQAAARGALAVPGAEMIEILVHIANHNKVFGQQARMTLAGLELKSSLEAASNPATSQEVLDYLMAPENLRPPLLPALLENPSIKAKALLEMAARGSREVVDAMRASSRVKGSPEILRALAANPNNLQTEVSPQEVPAVEDVQPAVPEQQTASPEESSAAPNASEENILEDDAVVDAFLTEHARELVLEGEKPFQPLGGIQEFEILAPDHVPVATHAEEIQVTARATPEVKSPAKA